MTLIIPAYHEEAGIGHVVADARAALAQVNELPESAWEVLVVDDGSTDATGREAATAGARVVRHRENRGYGASLKTGLRNARFETIVIADGDGTYPVSAVPELLAMLADCDMAVGARTGAEVHIPAIRKPAKWLLTMTAQFLAGRRIPDLNSGLRVFRRHEALRFENLYPAGFSFTTTITLAYLSSQLVIDYLPINYHKRVGSSKIRPIRDTKNLFITVLRSILFFNPLRVCLPLGMLLIGLALVFALFIRDSQGHVMDGTITVLVGTALQIIVIGFLADILARMRP